MRDNLDRIAKSGGTDGAFIVDTGADVNSQFLDALNKVRGAAIGCNCLIPAAPAGEVIEHGMVNVEYSPGAGASLEMGADLYLIDIARLFWSSRGVS